ncbi:MAG: GNAT family N-acetyltransferase, partial [bacterium]|nr:GNAT family N-acetyltransferase [bacterium]
MDLNMVNTPQTIDAIAHMLNKAFPLADGYPTVERAIAEVLESLEEGKISLVALDEFGEVLGWVGAIEQYNGCAYELHPLVIREDGRGKGIGKLLVDTLEQRVSELGAMTMYLGTDDVDGGT